MPLLVHAPDIPQVTARGNKSRVRGQEMCCHMYLPSPGASFHSCKWVRKRWKPFSTPCLHSFLLNCPHKLTHRCCNINLFPLCPHLILSAVTLFTFLFMPQSFDSLYFLSQSSLSCSSSLLPTSLTLSHRPNLWTWSLTHPGYFQTGNVPGIYTVEPTGGLVPHYHE